MGGWKSRFETHGGQDGVVCERVLRNWKSVDQESPLSTAENDPPFKFLHAKVKFQWRRGNMLIKNKKQSGFQSGAIGK